MNMPLDLAMDRVMLRSSPRILRHLRSDMVCAVLGMAASSALKFYCRLGEKGSKCDIVSRSHPRTVFRVDQAPYPCPRFFW